MLLNYKDKVTRVMLRGINDGDSWFWLAHSRR